MEQITLYVQGHKGNLLTKRLKDRRDFKLPSTFRGACSIDNYTLLLNLYLVNNAKFLRYVTQKDISLYHTYPLQMKDPLKFAYIS